jgi:hypothetical protein
MKKWALCCVLVVAVVFSVTAQSRSSEQSDTAELTIEELYLSQDLELQILRGQAISNDREMKQLALRNLQSMIEGGAAGDGVYVILEALSTEGVTRQTRSNGQLVNNFPDIRRQAVELLGSVGGERAKVTLMRVVRDEREPMVLAEAAFALGQIGLNENNEVSDHLVQLLLRENASETPDNNLAYAIVLALENLSSSTGGLADPEVINALLETASAPYIRTVRLRAVQAIVNMREHG